MLQVPLLGLWVKYRESIFLDSFSIHEITNHLTSHVLVDRDLVTCTTIPGADRHALDTSFLSRIELLVPRFQHLLHVAASIRGEPEFIINPNKHVSLNLLKLLSGQAPNPSLLKVAWSALIRRLRLAQRHFHRLCFLPTDEEAAWNEIILQDATQCCPAQPQKPSIMPPSVVGTQHPNARQFGHCNAQEDTKDSGDGRDKCCWSGFRGTRKVCMSKPLAPTSLKTASPSSLSPSSTLPLRDMQDGVGHITNKPTTQESGGNVDDGRFPWLFPGSERGSQGSWLFPSVQASSILRYPSSTGPAQPIAESTPVPTALLSQPLGAPTSPPNRDATSPPRSSGVSSPPLLLSLDSMPPSMNHPSSSHLEAERALSAAKNPVSLSATSHPPPLISSRAQDKNGATLLGGVKSHDEANSDHGRSLWPFPGNENGSSSWPFPSESLPSIPLVPPGTHLRLPPPSSSDILALRAPIEAQETGRRGVEPAPALVKHPSSRSTPHSHSGAGGQTGPQVLDTDAFSSPFSSSLSGAAISALTPLPALTISKTISHPLHHLPTPSTPPGLEFGSIHQLKAPQDDARPLPYAGRRPTRLEIAKIDVGRRLTSLHRDDADWENMIDSIATDWRLWMGREKMNMGYGMRGFEVCINNWKNSFPPLGSLLDRQESNGDIPCISAVSKSPPPRLTPYHMAGDTPPPLTLSWPTHPTSPGIHIDTAPVPSNPPSTSLFAAHDVPPLHDVPSPTPSASPAPEDVHFPLPASLTLASCSGSPGDDDARPSTPLERPSTPLDAHSNAGGHEGVGRMPIALCGHKAMLNSATLNDDDLSGGFADTSTPPSLGRSSKPSLAFNDNAGSCCFGDQTYSRFCPAQPPPSFQPSPSISMVTADIGGPGRRPLLPASSQSKHPSTQSVAHSDDRGCIRPQIHNATTLRLRCGHHHSLCGKDDTGKSTLMEVEGFRSNVTPAAVGVIMYKVVGYRYIEQRINLRAEHARHSKCRQRFLDHPKSSHDADVATKMKDECVNLRRVLLQPWEAHTVSTDNNAPQTMVPVPIETKPMQQARCNDHTASMVRCHSTGTSTIQTAATITLRDVIDSRSRASIPCSSSSTLSSSSPLITNSAGLLWVALPSLPSMPMGPLDASSHSPVVFRAPSLHSPLITSLDVDGSDGSHFVPAPTLSQPPSTHSITRFDAGGRTCHQALDTDSPVCSLKHSLSDGGATPASISQPALTVPRTPLSFHYRARPPEDARPSSFALLRSQTLPVAEYHDRARAIEPCQASAGTERLEEQRYNSLCPSRASPSALAVPGYATEASHVAVSVKTIIGAIVDGQLETDTPGRIMNVIGQPIDERVPIKGVELSFVHAEISPFIDQSTMTSLERPSTPPNAHAEAWGLSHMDGFIMPVASSGHETLLESAKADDTSCSMLTSPAAAAIACTLDKELSGDHPRSIRRLLHYYHSSLPVLLAPTSSSHGLTTMSRSLFDLPPTPPSPHHGKVLRFGGHGFDGILILLLVRALGTGVMTPASILIPIILNLMTICGMMGSARPLARFAVAITSTRAWGAIGDRYPGGWSTECSWYGS